MFWNGNYSFFQYKGDITGYSGQDYDGPARYFFLVTSAIFIIACLIAFRKANKKQISIYLKVLAVSSVALYIGKTTWESYYDIVRGNGFNLYILPFDVCSLLMYASIAAAFFKGKIMKAGVTWLSTMGIVGGVSNMLFLRGLCYYPYFTFGAFYSMVWHIVMVFTGFFLIETNYIEIKPINIVYSFCFTLAFGIICIILNNIMDMDYMLLQDAGSVPIFDDLTNKLDAKGLSWLNPVIMLLAYLAWTVVWVMLPYYIKKLIAKIKSKSQKNEITKENA